MPSTSSIVTTSMIPTINTVHPIVDQVASKTSPSFPMHVASTSSSPLPSYSISKIQQQSDISPTFAFCPQKSSTPSSVSIEILKGGHATLTRTDSVSSCKSSASRSTSWPLQQIVEEEQCKFFHYEIMLTFFMKS